MSDQKCRLYVGNLAGDVNNEELMETFTQHGKVVEARVIKDHASGQSKGFGFVEMGSTGECDRAIKMVDGQELAGKKLRVNFARPKQER